MLSTARLRRGRNFLVLAFAVQVGNRQEEIRCADPVSLLRIASLTEEVTLRRKFVLPFGMG